MIQHNFSKILKDKGLTLDDVMRGTGLTMKTLTMIYSAEGKGIFFDTLDKLCNYLNVSVSELFTHTKD